MTPMMSLFLRCLVALALMVLLLSLADYSMAATPVDTVHNALEPFGPQGGHFVDLWRVFFGATTFVFIAILTTGCGRMAHVHSSVWILAMSAEVISLALRKICSSVQFSCWSASRSQT